MSGKKHLYSILVFVAVFFVGVASAQDIDLTTNMPVSQKEGTDLPPLMPSQGCKILWDTSNGIYISYSPSGYYSSLTTLLENKGYTMDENSQGVLNVNLDEYGIIVVCVGSAWDYSYTTDEVAAIEGFVQQGGGLLVMGDNPNCNNHNINPVSTAFGTTCGISNLPSSIITDFASHPVFNGVSAIYMAAGGEIDSVSPSEEIAWDAGLGAVSEAEVGTGRVIVMGDINSFTNSYIGNNDNQLFAENVFDWLCPLQGCVLLADANELSARDGGVINFDLLAGDENGNRKYFLLGSASGTDPGTLLPGGLATLPLNMDFFTYFVIAMMNTALFDNFMGELDGSGIAEAQMAVKGIGSSPGCVGTVLHFAYALPAPWDCASNAVAVEIVD
jgi:hypothetical protein